MLDNTTLDAGYHGGLIIEGNAAANLRKAGKWARFTGITLIIFTAISLLSFAFTGASMFDQPGLEAFSAFGVPLFILLFALTLFSLYLYYLIFDFGRKAMQAVDNKDQLAMQSSFASLSSFYTIVGVLIMIYLVLVGIVMVIGIGGALLY